MIGLCLEFHSSMNYGTNLQAYATKLAIEELGYETELIIYIKEKSKICNFKQALRLTDPIVFKTITTRMIKRVNLKVRRKYAYNLRVRAMAIDNFRKKYLSNYVINFGYQDLKENAKKYDTLLVGSDQLWLPSAYNTRFYTLMFAPDEIPKVSYATSFGIEKLPNKYVSATKEFLSRFDAISVREISGKEIVDSVAGRHAELVCDPTMLFTREKWEKIIPKKRIINEPYILCYFLGKNRSHRLEVNKLKNATGLKIVVLRHLDQYVPADEEYGDYAPYNVSPADFMNLIRYAEYVCTDSFHGTVFSIIHHKKFLTFYRFSNASSTSRNTRIDSLFSVLGLEARLYKGDIINEIMADINYVTVQEKLDKFRDKSYNFLINALSKAKKPKSTSFVEDFKYCTGCTACANSCPKRAITMIPDGAGFLSPRINKSLCINCSLCVKVCPANKEELSSNKNIPICIGVQNKNQKYRNISSAGGFFAAIAEAVLQHGGVVVAAVFDDQCSVHHKCITSLEEFEKSGACGAKYVASDLKNVFTEITQHLRKEKLVCFCGLPCQVAGLSSYIKTVENISYDKLILIDLTCYGSPSPILYKKFLECCAVHFKSEIKSVNFRDKTYGYSAPSMSIKLRNGKKKCQSELVKSYLRAYFKGLSAREECYCCRFRTLERVTDFTLGDCRNIGRYHKELDDDKGTTVVYVHSHKGQALLDMIKEKIVCVPLNINDIISTCGTKMLQNPPRNTTSYSFKKDIGSSMPYETLIRYYCPADIEERIATIVKPVIYKLRLHKLGFLKKLKGF